MLTLEEIEARVAESRNVKTETKRYKDARYDAWNSGFCPTCGSESVERWQSWKTSGYKCLRCNSKDTLWAINTSY